MLSSNRKTSSYQIKITKVEQILQFIKITAQNLNDLNYIQLSTGLEKIFKTAKALKDEELALGETYIAKMSDDSSFQRCRVLDSDDFSSVAMVDFIDLGYHGRVKYNELRAFPENSELQTLPSVSKEFILGELIIIQKDPVKIKRFEDLIRNKTATMQILGQNETDKIVELRFAQSSFAHEIVMKHPILNTAFKLISIEDQLKMLSKTQATASTSTSVANEIVDKINYPLPQDFFEPNGCDITISAYERGPKDFYVQLNGSLEKYQNLNIKLRSDKASLKHESSPKVNEMYAAIIEYNSVERVMILRKMSDSLYLVRLVDYGSKRIINVSQICKLPKEFKFEPFAWRFELSGVEELNHLNISELNFYFFYITRDKKLKLHIDREAEEIGEANLCSLFDGNTNILVRIKNFNPRTLKYPTQVPLQIGTIFRAKISSIESSKVFYIIRDNITPSKLFEELQLYSSCRLEKPEKDNLCCLQIKGKSFRGIVLKPLSLFTITCQLVDTGRIDDFTAHEVKIMIEKFAKLPLRAYKCNLFGLDETKLTMFSKSLKDICSNNQAFYATVKDYKDGVYHVKLETEDKKDVLEEMMKVPTLIISPARRPVLQPQRSNSFRNAPANRKILEPLKMVEFDWNEEELNESWSTEGSSEKEDSNENMAVITSVQSPNDFVIQLTDSLQKMNEFFKNLQELGEKADPLTEFEKSEMCLIKNPYTNQWCRTMIIDSKFEKDKTEIKLKNVDDGVIYTIDDATVLKKYPFQCLTVVNFGIRCSLPVKIARKNLNEATEVMIHLIGKNIQYELICANEIANIVDVKICEGKRRIKSLIYELVKADLATKLEYIPDGFATGRIIHIENLSEFYVILEKDKGVHDLLKHHVQFFERKPLKYLTINKRIMAINGINHQWERAKIIAVEDDEVEVKFLDHGSIQKLNLDNTGEISCHIESWEPLAYCCSIYMPKNVDPKTIAAVERFKEAAKDDKIFGIKMMKSTKKCSVVQLMLETISDNGENIMDDFGKSLISLCCLTVNSLNNSSESSILDDDE